MLPPGRAIFMRRMKNKITAREKSARDKAALKAARRERKADQKALKKDRKAQVIFMLRIMLFGIVPDLAEAKSRAEGARAPVARRRPVMGSQSP